MDNLTKISLNDLLNDAEKIFRYPSQNEERPKGILITGNTKAEEIHEAFKRKTYFKEICLIRDENPKNEYKENWYRIDSNYIELSH